MKFLVPNYSCFQNPWLGGYHPQIPVLSALNWICWTPPPEKNPGYATARISQKAALNCVKVNLRLCVSWGHVEMRQAHSGETLRSPRLPTAGTAFLHHVRLHDLLFIAAVGHDISYFLFVPPWPCLPALNCRHAVRHVSSMRRRTRLWVPMAALLPTAPHSLSCHPRELIRVITEFWGFSRGPVGRTAVSCPWGPKPILTAVLRGLPQVFKTFCIVTRAGAGQEESWFDSWLFSSPNWPYRHWGWPSHPFGGYQGWSGCDMKLTSYRHLVPRLRMSGATPPLLLSHHGL